MPVGPTARSSKKSCAGVWDLETPRCPEGHCGMPEETLKALEYPGLLRVVQPYAASRRGRAFLARLRPSADFAAIQVKFAEIRELQDLESREGDIPLFDFVVLFGIESVTIDGRLTDSVNNAFVS